VSPRHGGGGFFILSRIHVKILLFNQRTSIIKNQNNHGKKRTPTTSRLEMHQMRSFQLYLRKEQNQHPREARPLQVLPHLPRPHRAQRSFQAEVSNLYLPHPYLLGQSHPFRDDRKHQFVRVEIFFGTVFEIIHPVVPPPLLKLLQTDIPVCL